MSSPLPFVHTLVRIGSGKRRYWLAPAEMRSDEPQTSRYALPVDKDKKPFPAYQVEVLRFGSNGRREIRETVTLKKDSHSGDFSMQIGSNEGRLGPRRDRSASSCFPYKGKLVHPDFDHLLAALEPCDLGQIDRLFLEERLLILGCDPFAHYGGLNGQSPGGGHGDGN